MAFYCDNNTCINNKIMRTFYIMYIIATEVKVYTI
jgi:hypothetical protein